MAYSGAWKASVMYDPAERVRHTADPAHSQTNTPDPNAAIYSAPPLQDVGVSGEFPGMDWVVQTPGMTGDQTPQTHTTPGTQPSYPTELEMQTASAAVHSQDFGAARARTYARPIIEQAGTTYSNPRFESLPAQVVDPIAGRRGLNSLPENNPEGFRQGYVDQYWVDRKFYVGERVHEQRPITPNLAYVPGNTPPKGGAYNSPFDSAARAVRDVMTRPMVRREPTTISDQVATDGTAAGIVAARVDDWVVG